jgi:methyl-accepting chemotaxis protein
MPIEVDPRAPGTGALGREISTATERRVRGDEARRYEQMIQQVPVNVMACDRDLVIRYMNAAARNTLERLAAHLPVSVDEVVGSSMDIFHKAPAHARRIAADPKSLPHRATIKLGPETISLLVTAIVDSSGKYIGPMLTWEVVTEQAKAADQERRLRQMIDGAPSNLMYCDADLTIMYMNEASRKTLNALQQYLPVPVDKIVGSSIDIFHKHPSHQRQLLADPRNLPHRANIKLGPETLALSVSAITDASGSYIGPMLTWERITEQLANERKVREAAEREEQVRGELQRQAESLGSSSEALTSVSHGVAAAAEQTSAQASTVSAAARVVNANIQTVAASAEEMTASIREIAKSATEAAQVATSAVRVAEKTNANVVKLGESSAEIGKVIKVITSIAQQTNLLALNATIEAARAGEAGKGFAVVANEVKELAKATAKATEDISQKIEAIQADTRGAVSAISQITAIIAQINDIQSTIASAVEEQTATTNEISRNVAEAAKGSSDITQNITGVAEAARDAARGAAGTQEAAAGLNRVAGELRSLVAKLSSRQSASG